jgi:hypothetical protein
VTEPTEDKALEEYLRRKSALSMGYRRMYIEEAPPPELDRAITARARRALRWLAPALVAAVMAVALIGAANYGVKAWMNAMVVMEKSMKQRRDERQKQLEKERAEQPIGVVIDADDIPKQDAADAAAREQIDRIARAAWLEKIEALKREGKTEEAEAEMQRFRQAYPDAAK